MKKLLVFIFIISSSAFIFAQSNEENTTSETDLFDDPFAVLDDEEPDPPDFSEDEITAGLDDFDSLFENDDIEEIQEDDSAPDLASELLQEEGVRWSGSFSGRIDLGYTWNNWWEDLTLRRSDDNSLSPSVSASLRFNARPDTEYRVAGKFSIDLEGGSGLEDLMDFSNYSIVPDGGGGFLIVYAGDSDNDGGLPDQNPTTLALSVQELFADFNWDRKLFFRFGKSFIKWSKGYFWSPADIVNLSTIDAEDPTSERQGPVNLKINYPFSSNNLNLYLLLDGAVVPEHTAFVLNSEFVIGDFEVGFGAYYKYDHAPRLVSLFSGSIGEIGVFGEGVVSFGSDRVFVRESRIQDETFVKLDTYTVDWLPFFSGTIGGMYMNNDINMNIIGQYFFNGEGYAEKRFSDGSSLLENAVYLYSHPEANGMILLPEEQGADYEDPPELGTNDLMNFGQHYLGLSVMFMKLFDTDLGFSIFWLASLTDWSGIVSPALSYKLFDKFTASLSARLTYGGKGDEYTNPMALFMGNEQNYPQVPTFDLTLSLSIGGGSF